MVDQGTHKAVGFSFHPCAKYGIFKKIVDTHGLTPVALDILNIYFSLGIHPCAHAHGLLLFLINLLLKNTDGYNELTEVVLY